ncbi:MAG: hypothetical protein WC052_03595 [Patescibacteria group bacterium]
MKKIISSLLVACIFLLQLQPALAQEVYPEFSANILIPDAAFTDTSTFGGPEGIQHFLESKGSVLANTQIDFLIKLNEPNDTTVKQALDDPQPNIGRLRTAAELIWDAARASGLNPQIILVTLQKEQGLIANKISPDRLPLVLNRALGFDCPIATGCGNLFPGFYYQLFGNIDTEGNRYLGAPKSLVKSFTTPGGRGPTINGATTKVGDSIVLTNTVGDYANVQTSQSVTLGNRATAALYRYTPHVFNGNYNFWKFFTGWFKYPNGTLIKTLHDNVVFIIQDGSRQHVPGFVAAARTINQATALTVSPIELTNYPLGPTYGPNDNTVVTANGTFFVFIANVMHPATTFVLQQRKLDPTKSLSISPAEASLFTTGPQLTPSNGTVVRGETNPAIYLVDQSVLKLFTPFTLQQHNAGNLVQKIPDAEISLYAKQGHVFPLKGTLIKSAASTSVYLMSEAQRLPLTADLFKNLGFNTKTIATVNDVALAEIPVGASPTPRDGTYFTSKESKEMYVFKGGAKHPISAFVAKQRAIKPDYAFEASIVSNWPDGIALTPKDGTLIKSNLSASVYVVMSGQLRPLTAELFKNLGYNFKNVATIPDNEVAVYPKESFATPKENTYFSVAETQEFYLFSKGTKRRIYPFIAKQRGMTPDYTFSIEVASGWQSGIPVAARDGTLVKSETLSTVYVVVTGTLRPLTSTAFARRGYSSKKITVIPQTELDGLPKGALIQ